MSHTDYKVLVFIAKIFQNLANKVFFTEEETKPYNELITKRYDEMINFLKTASTHKTEDRMSGDKIEISRIVLCSDVRFLVDLYSKNNEKIKHYFEEEENQIAYDEFLSLEKIIQNMTSDQQISQRP